MTKIFTDLFVHAAYNPSQENGGVNQRLEKLEQFLNIGKKEMYL